MKSDLEIARETPLRPIGEIAAKLEIPADALEPYGVTHADMPLTPAQVWLAMQGRPARTDLAFT